MNFGNLVKRHFKAFMFIADIVAVNVDEKLIDKNGKLYLDKANLMAYSHGEYFELGKKIGKFGYSVQKKK